MDPLLVKTIHQAAVALSFLGFVARGIGAFSGASWVQERLARTLPHVVDTVLLLSALALAWLYRLDPTATPWLRAKVIGLVLYVVLGMLALKPGRPMALRGAAWVAALLVFAWIVSVAITKSPLGFLSLV